MHPSNLADNTTGPTKIFGLTIDQLQKCVMIAKCGGYDPSSTEEPKPSSYPCHPSQAFHQVQHYLRTPMHFPLNPRSTFEDSVQNFSAKDLYFFTHQRIRQGINVPKMSQVLTNGDILQFQFMHLESAKDFQEYLSDGKIREFDRPMEQLFDDLKKKL